MRYRKLTAAGDYSFGNGQGDFYVDRPEAVAQAVATRLALLTGEWFLDTAEGTPYAEQVIGTGTQATYDAAIQRRVVETEGVTDIAEYSSQVEDRALSIQLTINTKFGEAQLSLNLQGPTQ